MFDFIIDSIESGGWTLLPIFGAGVWAWVLVVNSAFRLYFLALPARITRVLTADPSRVDAWYKAKGKRYVETVSGNILDRLVQLPQNADQEYMENVVDEVMRYRQPQLDKDLSLVGVLASMAPLLGLFGTVTGMITTFRVIGSFGTSNPALMADSIAEALVTTQDGLVIAFPLMIVHLFIFNYAIRIEKDAQNLAFQYILHRVNNAGGAAA